MITVKMARIRPKKETRPNNREPDKKPVAELSEAQILSQAVKATQKPSDVTRLGPDRIRRRPKELK